MVGLSTFSVLLYLLLVDVAVCHRRAAIEIKFTGGASLGRI
jgi:hypothetical protein